MTHILQNEQWKKGKETCFTNKQSHRMGHNIIFVLDFYLLGSKKLLQVYGRTYINVYQKWDNFPSVHLPEKYDIFPLTKIIFLLYDMKLLGFRIKRGVIFAIQCNIEKYIFWSIWILPRIFFVLGFSLSFRMNKADVCLPSSYA